MQWCHLLGEQIMDSNRILWRWCLRYGCFYDWKYFLRGKLGNNPIKIQLLKKLTTDWMKNRQKWSHAEQSPLWSICMLRASSIVIWKPVIFYWCRTGKWNWLILEFQENAHRFHTVDRGISFCTKVTVFESTKSHSGTNAWYFYWHALLDGARSDYVRDF